MVKRFNTKFTLCDCSFGVVRSTKNYGPYKNRFSGYGSRFDIYSKCYCMLNGLKMLIFLVETIVYHYTGIIEEKIYFSS